MPLLAPRSRGESTDGLTRQRRRLRLSVAVVLAAIAGLLLATGPATAKPGADSALAGLYGAADPTYDGVFRQSLGILGVVAAGETPSEEAVGWLLDQQCADGGFMAFNPVPSKPCWPRTPSTSWARTRTARHSLSRPCAPWAVRRPPRQRLTTSPRRGPRTGAGPTSPAATPTRTRPGLVLLALNAVGEGVDQDAVDVLAAAQVDCTGDPLDQGGITSPFSGGAPDILATVQAVPGVAGADLLDGPASTAPWVDDALPFGCPVANDNAETVGGWAASWLEEQVAADAVSGGNAPWAVLSFAATRTGRDEAEELYAGIVADLGPDPAAKKSASSALTAQTDESPGALGLAALSAAVLGENADLPGLASRIGATETAAPTVEPSPEPTPSPSQAGPEAEGGAQLPDTGTDPSLVLLGTSLVLAGGALVLATRRRRASTDSPAGGGDHGPVTAHRRVITRVLALVGTLVVASTGVLMAAVPAHAASEYRYWSYWHVAAGGAAWTYAGTGPGGFRVDDGAVEGWRFAVAAPNPSGPAPRTAASGAFAAICGNTPRPDGADRVALVVDFGKADDAPPRESPPGGVRGTCVVVPDRSNGSDVLATAGYAPAAGLQRAALLVVRLPRAGVRGRRQGARTGSQPACHHDARPDSDAAGLTRRPVLGRSDRPRVVRGTGSHPAGLRRFTPSSDAVALGDAGGRHLVPLLGFARARPDGRATTAAASRTVRPAGGFAARGRPRRGRRRGRSRPGSVDRREGPVVTARAIPRALHPGGWWLWGLGLATAASRTNNLLVLALIVTVAGFVVAARRTTAPWSRAFRASLVLGAVVIAVRLVFEVVFGTDPGPSTLIALPELPLPSWAAGVSIGGPITLEGLLAALRDGAQIAAMIACVGAANALANPSRLLKAVPGALYEVGVSVVVALTLAPQALEDVQRLRQARRLRGRTDRGLSGLATVALPALEGALHRSLHLAASMDARGYGRQADVPARTRRLSAALVLGGLTGLVISLYGLLDAGSPGLLGLPLALVGLGLAAAGFRLAGRAEHPDPLPARPVARSRVADHDQRRGPCRRPRRLVRHGRRRAPGAPEPDQLAHPSARPGTRRPDRSPPGLVHPAPGGARAEPGRR